MVLNVVGALLIHDNKILLPKRAPTLKKMPDKYEFPGGKVEQGESLKDALVRELKEELSIDVDICDIIDFPNNYLITNNFTLTIFIIKKWNNTLTINTEINSEILEVELDRLHNVDDLLETNKLLIPAIFKFIKEL